MTTREVSPGRLNAFSDAVFAVIITILVLELRPPAAPSVASLVALWPTALSYAISYLFIAIVWINHHHLLGYADVATPRLIWVNFAHLFPMSLLPFSTAWIADTELAAIPVAFYASVFVLVNITYIALSLEIVERADSSAMSRRMRRIMRIRSFVTLGVFASAAVLAIRYPLGGMALICLCLIVYMRPEAPGADA